jgi:hypothetical protein
VHVIRPEEMNGVVARVEAGKLPRERVPGDAGKVVTGHDVDRIDSRMEVQVSRHPTH